MSFQSTTHPAMPPQKGAIRAETHIAGYVMKPCEDDPNSTEFCILSQVDIKVIGIRRTLIYQGMVPKFIVNYVAGKAPAEWLQKLTKACERAREQARGTNKSNAKGKKK